MEEYLTIQEVEKLLKVSERTVRRWIGTGELPAVKIGRSVRIRREDLDRPSRRPAEQPTSSTREAQLAALARARDLRRKMAARKGQGSGSSVEMLSAIRLERAGAR